MTSIGQEFIKFNNLLIRMDTRSLKHITFKSVSQYNLTQHGTMASKSNTGIVQIILSGLYKNVLKNVPFNFAMSVYLPVCNYFRTSTKWWRRGVWWVSLWLSTCSNFGQKWTTVTDIIHTPTCFFTFLAKTLHTKKQCRTKPAEKNAFQAPSTFSILQFYSLRNKRDSSAV